MDALYVDMLNAFFATVKGDGSLLLRVPSFSIDLGFVAKEWVCSSSEFQSNRVREHTFLIMTTWF